MAKNTKVKFVLTKQEAKTLAKWIKTQPTQPPVSLIFCFSRSSGIGVKCVVRNIVTNETVDVTDYTSW